jgi:tRNA A37 threonylcarbamoyladenosine synthetase subunit TsaC/SUA5/YrdC
MQEDVETLGLAIARRFFRVKQDTASTILPHEADHDIEADARKVFDVLVAGGVAIIYLDVAYAVLGRTEESVRRIYGAKNRSFSKPTGLVGCPAIHDALHILGERKAMRLRHRAHRRLLALAVVAPFRRDHPFLRNMDPFVLDNAVKGDTLNLLLNAGTLRNRIGTLSWEHGIPLVGSSANVSLTGSRYRVEDLEPELLNIADIVIDYGESKYHNRFGHSSTMIDFRDFSIVRRGVCFDEIAHVLATEFSIILKERPL